jgi:hypothetical protein
MPGIKAQRQPTNHMRRDAGIKRVRSCMSLNLRSQERSGNREHASKRLEIVAPLPGEMLDVSLFLIPNISLRID